MEQPQLCYSTGRQERDTDTGNVMCPERCYLFIIGEHIPGYPNVAMPSDGGVHTYSISEVQRLKNAWVYKEFISYLNI